MRGANLRPSLGGRFDDSKNFDHCPKRAPRVARFVVDAKSGSIFPTPKRARFATPFLHTSTFEVCVLDPPPGGWGGTPGGAKSF